MRWWCLALGMFLLAGAAQAQAQDARDEGRAAAILGDAPAVATVAAEPGATIAELERSLEFIYAEVEALRRAGETSVGGLLAIGTGAGVGFVVGSLVSGGMLVPAAVGMAATAGLAGAWVEALGPVISTVSTVGFTLAGARVGDALVE